MKKRRQEESGFTLIELMITMVVFMVAVVGLVGMQKASVEAAQRAKQQTAAYNIARFVTTQLKAEFASWRRAEPQTFVDPDDTRNLSLPLISKALEIDETSGANSVNSWILYGDGEDNFFRIDEFLGHSRLTGQDATARFCVNYMIAPAAVAALNIDAQAVWRTRVRVTWTREGLFAGSNWTDCTEGAVRPRLQNNADNVVELVSMATREFAK
jgi:prepilin-type N-terminal cleavage/methylation domain-containing protein